MQKIITFAKQKPLLFIIAAGVLASCLCIVFALIFAPSPDPTTVAQATAPAAQDKTAAPVDTSAPTLPPTVTNTPEPTNTPAPTKTPAPTNTPRPTNTATPPPEPIPFTGSGDGVVDVEMGWDNGALVEIAYTGGGNFAVWNLDANNEKMDLLVNTIGKYQGRRLIDIMVGEGPTRRLEINASGPWTITIYPLSLDYVRVCNAPGLCEGAGDDVVALSGNPDTMQVEYNSPGNFAIWSYADSVDLLVNEIDTYSGKVLLDNGTFLLEITAGGPWTLDITGR